MNGRWHCIKNISNVCICWILESHGRRADWLKTLYGRGVI